MSHSSLRTLAISLILLIIPGCMGKAPVEPLPPAAAALAQSPPEFGTIATDTRYLERLRIDTPGVSRYRVVDIQDLDLRVPGRVLDPPSAAKALLPQDEEIEQEIWQKANNENERNIDSCVQKFVDLRGHTLRILGELRE